MSEFDNERFRQITGQYGQVEAQAGHDLYQANVEATKSQAEHNRMQIAMMDEQRELNQKSAEGMHMFNASKILFWSAYANLIRSVSGVVFILGILGIIHYTSYIIGGWIE